LDCQLSREWNAGVGKTRRNLEGPTAFGKKLRLRSSPLPVRNDSPPKSEEKRQIRRGSLLPRAKNQPKFAKVGMNRHEKSIKIRKIRNICSD
jgi:hypothetical protein